MHEDQYCPLEKLLNIQPQYYVRLFEFRNVPLIFDSLWLTYWQEHTALCINVDGIRTAYIPKEEHERTLTFGKLFYGDQNRIQKYRDSFDQNVKLLYSCASTLIDTDDQCHMFAALTREVFRQYALTDFLYTDRALEEIQTNFKDFGRYKEEKHLLLHKVYVGEDSYLYSFLKRRSEQLQTNVDQLSSCTWEEVLSEELPNVSTRQDYVAFVMNNAHYILEGKRARDIAKQIRSSTLGKGVVAHKGIARGPAFVFHNDMSSISQISSVANTMPSGCILVCETTSPDLAPLYSKASGLITAQGGVMSHAAIISREMNLPCIVGMENATRHFLTGDLIELDAVLGNVRKLL